MENDATIQKNEIKIANEIFWDAKELESSGYIMYIMFSKVEALSFINFKVTNWTTPGCK
jgi:hypothetical protein